MYDPLVVDTFVNVHTAIAPAGQPSPVPASLEAITVAALPPPSAQGLQSLDEISASAEEMLALFDLSRGLSSHMGLSDAADVILKHLKRLVPFTSAVIFLYAEESDDLVAAYTLGEHGAFLTGMRVSLGQRLTGWVGANRQTIRNSDPSLDLGEIARSSNPRLRSAMATALLEDRRLVGVLTLYSIMPGAFSDDHQRVLELVAPQLGPVLQQAALSDQSSKVVHRDQVTGLPNVEKLKQFASNHGADNDTHVPTAVIHIDVHGLKGLNAAHGRDVGDQVLVHVARCAKRQLRSGDVIFRYASDEFAVILLHTVRARADDIAARIQEAVATAGADLVGVRPTVSTSVAATPEDGKSVHALLHAARLRSRPRHTPRPERPQRTDSIH
jgi:diguanylate cyclase (GGDEF)-like protein